MNIGTITVNEKIIKDHKKKSNQVRRLKRALRLKTIHSVNKEETIKKLQDKLNYLQDYKRNPVGYYWDSNSGHQHDIGKRTGQIEMLEEVINLIKNDVKSWW